MQGLCLSYAPRQEGVTADTDISNNVQVMWHSMNAGRLKIPGLIRYVRCAKRLIRDFKPDVILACADSFYGIIGTRLAKKMGTRCVFDLYDNFASFGSAYVPGVLPLYRLAVRTAEGVTCVSSALKGLVTKRYGRTRPTVVISNAIQTGVFYPRDKNTCRHLLGLPTHATIIGTAGALYRNRGIGALLRGFEQLAAQDSAIHLALAGPRDKTFRSASVDRVHDLGILSPEKVPLLINALDVAVVCNRDSAFGRYCFPQKAYEIMACRIPLVAAGVGTMEELLAAHPESLFAPNNATDLARAVRTQLRTPRVCDMKIPTWDDMAARLEAFLHDIVTNRHQ